jgi:hypothetical protein
LYNTTKNSEYPLEYHGNICTALGITGVLPVNNQLPICFVCYVAGKGSSAYENYFVGYCFEKIWQHWTKISINSGARSPVFIAVAQTGVS